MSNQINFTQELTLPSQGLLNPEIPGGKVVQRCMMVSDQKTLAGSNVSSGVAIRQLIKKTITEPADIDVDELSLPDTLYLLFKLRILSYGKEYKFIARCPECGKKIPVSLDLSELTVETLEEGYEENLVVTLPHRGDTVYTQLLTNKDSDLLNEELKRRKKKNPEDASDYVLRVVQSIRKIKLDEDGRELTHPLDIERYVESLTDLDASAILSARNSVRYGVTPVVERVCPECGEYIDIDIKFSSDFFRPSAIR